MQRKAKGALPRPAPSKTTGTERSGGTAGTVGTAPREKRAAFDAVRASLAIAEWLYGHNPGRYKPLYAFINGSAKRRKEPALILASVERLLEREFNRPVLDVMDYLGGTLRKLEQEHDAARSRRGEPTSAGRILAECFERMKKG